jgi:hypothetical protein
MPRQAIYVHGNAVVMRYPGGKGDPTGSPHTPNHQMNGVLDRDTGCKTEWSDVVGLHGPRGVTFAGRNRQTNTFYAVVPTPVWRDDVRAKLARVAIKFASDPGVVITGIRVSDGARDIPFTFPTMRLGGDHSRDWEPNVNFFDNPSPPEIESCVCLIFDVSFDREGDITFCALGCDFIV